MTNKLKRAIGKKTLFFLAINAIVGAEIFFMPGITYSYAGPIAIFSWLIMALVAIMMSTYFAELVSRYPKLVESMNIPSILMENLFHLLSDGLPGLLQA